MTANASNKLRPKKGEFAVSQRWEAEGSDAVLPRGSEDLPVILFHPLSQLRLALQGQTGYFQEGGDGHREPTSFLFKELQGRSISFSTVPASPASDSLWPLVDLVNLFGP